MVSRPLTTQRLLCVAEEPELEGSVTAEQRIREYPSAKHGDGLESARAAEFALAARAETEADGGAPFNGRGTRPRSAGIVNGSKERPSKRQRLPGRIARDLAAAILSGSYQPGDRLFGEIAFSDRLNVSRTTYRQAIQILASKGLVSSNPRRGTIVNVRSMWQFLDPEVLGLVFEIGPQAPILEELRELLLMLVPKAAAMAAERRSEAMLAGMQANIETLKLNAPDSGQRASLDFHSAIFLASGNSYVMSLARGLAAALGAAVAFRQRKGLPSRNLLAVHMKLLQSIAEQDAAGAEQQARAMIQHVFLTAA